MNRPIRRVALGLLIALSLLVVDITYWQVLAADRLRAHPDNPRLIIARSGHHRGQIISADATLLATSIPDPSDSRYYMRDYPHGSLYAHTVGFSSRTLGDRGIEASHAALLSSGQELTVSGIINRLLGEDVGPHSIQLTLNHRLQQMARRALGGRQGAIVAIEPASGRLLALVNSPSFDPNSLVGLGARNAWEALISGSGRALLNRSTGEQLQEGLVVEELLADGLGEGDTRPVAALPIGLRMATLAGDGLLMAPHIVTRVFHSGPNLESAFEPVLLDREVSSEEALAAQARMEPLVIPTENLGPLPGLGETGYGMTPTGDPAVWFAGYGPVSQPAIVVAVVIESLEPIPEPGIGSAEAASIGRAVMHEWLSG